jgi:hypothetical protein
MALGRTRSQDGTGEMDECNNDMGFETRKKERTSTTQMVTRIQERSRGTVDKVGLGQSEVETSNIGTEQLKASQVWVERV